MIKKIALGVMLGTSSLLAINSVSNLSVTAPHNSGTVTNDSNLTFNWNPPTDVNASKYYYVLDTNSSGNIYSRSYVTIPSGTTDSIDLTVSSSGEYYFHIAAVDENNTASAVSSYKVDSTIDLDAGTVTVSPDGGSITTSNNDVTLSGSETGTIYYTLDGSTPETNSSQYSSALNIGVSATLKTFLVDTAGNRGSVVTKTFTISNDPTITTATDANISGQTIATSSASGATAVTALKVSGTDLTRYQYAIDSDSGHIERTDINATIDISSLSTGSHTVYVRGGDAYNYQATSTSVTFTVDNTAPSALSISYDGNSTVTTVNPSNKSNASTIITLSATDSSSIGYKIQSTCPTTFAEYDAYSSAFSLGDNLSDAQTVKVCMAAVDSAGNLATTSKTFTIDKTAPTVTLNPSVDTVFSTTQDVTFSSNDSNATTYYQLTDTNSTPSTSSLNSWTAATSVTANHSGEKYLYVIAVDSVENVSSVSSIKLTKQSTTKILSADSSVNLGNVKTGSNTSQTLTITNTGTESITIAESNISVSGSDFNITSTTCDDAAISSTATCSVVIGFTSPSVGAHTSTLSIIYDGTNESNLTVALSATGINAEPNATYSSTITVLEDNSTSVQLTGTDPENSSLSYYAGSSSDFNGTVSIETNGTTTVTPTANFNGSGWFTYYVNDGESNSSEANVSISVTAVNDLPSITLSSDSIQANNDTFGTGSNDGNITFSYTDVDEDNVTATVTVNATNGTATISGNVISYNGNNGAPKGADSFTVVFSDGNDGNVTQVISVAVANVVPEVDANNSTINEDQNATGNINVSDSDGDDINVTISSNASNGSVIISDSNVTSDENQTTYTYTPNSNYNGSDSFTLKFNDGFGGIITKTISVTINSINDVPTIDTNFSNLNILEDNGTISYDINVSDVEGNDLNLTVESNNTSLMTVSSGWSGLLSQGNYNGNTLDFNLSTVANASGIARITITLQDENSTSTSFDVNVSAVNDAPVLSIPSSVSKNEDFSDFNITLTASDVDDTNLTYSVDSNDTTIADVNITGGFISVSGVANANGTVKIDVNVTDGNLTDTGSIILTVTAQNDAPVVQALSDVNITEDGTISVIEVNASDVDDTNLTYDANSSDTSIATVSIVDGNLTVTPVSNASGTVTITAIVTDGTVTTIQTFTLNISAVDDAPTFDNSFSNITKNEDNGSFVIDMSATDVEGHSITYSAESNVSSIVDLNISSDGNLTVTLLDNKNGDVNITLRATANGLDTNTSFILSITAVNDAPVINNKFNILSRKSGASHTYSAIEINATDVDVDDNLTYDANSSDTNISTVAVSDNNITITTLANVSGDSIITVIVSDGNITTTKEIFVKIGAHTTNDGNITTSGITIESGKKSIAYLVSELNTTAQAVSRVDFDDDSIGGYMQSSGGNDINIKSENNASTYEVNTTTNTTKVSLDTGSIERELVMGWNDGNVSGSIKNSSNVSTTLSINIGTDINATIKTDGSIESSFKPSSSSAKITIVIDQTGVVKPTNSAAATPKELPAGTKVDVSGSVMKFTVPVDSKIEFN